MTRIGVLGGIGPEATAEFYRKLVLSLQTAGIHDNTDFPQIFINSIPAPEIIDHHATDAEVECYLNGLRELDSMGVDFIVMVCNTIHIYYEFLQNSIGTRIIDLRNAVLKNIMRRETKSFLLLGTRGTIESGLYNFDGFLLRTPDNAEINEIADMITAFNRGSFTPQMRARLVDICFRYPADCILLGCTEIAIMLGDLDAEKINTIDILVEATMNSINMTKNK